MTAVQDLSIRIATEADLPALRALMNRSIGELQRGFLDPAQVAASFDIMGLDTQLVADRTYFVVEAGGGFKPLERDAGGKPLRTFPHPTLAGCGGWSRRATLFGGDHTAGRDAALLDPAREAARIRAMYTSPDFTRRGVGRLIIETCEAAARAEGFTRCEMAATLAGEPLYLSCGYEVIEPFDGVTSTGARVPLKRMGKAI
jgi:GNAT superfamily N-acetyltransferase